MVPWNCIILFSCLSLNSQRKFSALRFAGNASVSELYSSLRIYRGALWILGEYCSTKEDIQSVMTEVRRSLGEVCFTLVDVTVYGDFSFSKSDFYVMVCFCVFTCWSCVGVKNTKNTEKCVLITQIIKT